jgi:hypothetical protein
MVIVETLSFGGPAFPPSSVLDPLLFVSLHIPENPSQFMPYQHLPNELLLRKDPQVRGNVQISLLAIVRYRMRSVEGGRGTPSD